MNITKIRKRARLVLLTVMATVSAQLYARDIAYEHEGVTLNYTVIDETARTVMVKAGTSAAPGNNLQNVFRLVIPDKIEADGVEYTVTEIGNFAFYGCRGIYAVEFPETLVSIGNAAFASNGGLSSITIPDAVTTIGNGAFSDCVMLIDLQLGKSVESIGSGAFLNCENIKSLILPGSLTKLGSSAFNGCLRLQEVILPPSLTSVGNGVFEGCTSLVKCACPATISTPFPSVEIFVNYPADGATVENGCVWGSGKSALYYVTLTAKGEFDIPATVTNIGYSAFEGCSEVTAVTFPNSLTSIENRAFRYCSSLNSAILPPMVTKIGDYSFQSCSSLENVSFPDKLTELGEGAFLSCTALKSAILPNSLTKINNDTFSYCISLTTLILPDLLTDIGNYAFFQCTSLIKVVIPNSVVHISEHSFSDCNSLSEVVLGNSVEAIENLAFYNTNISSITFPASLTRLGYQDPGALATSGVFTNSPITYAKFQNATPPEGPNPFYSHSSNETPKMPSQITVDIPENSLCDYLIAYNKIDNVLVEGTPTRLSSTEGMTYRLIDNPSGRHEAVLLSCNNKSITEVVFDKISVYNASDFTEIEYTVTGIMGRFPEGSQLKSLTIGNDITHIGFMVFRDCLGLETINFNAENCVYAYQSFYPDDYVGSIKSLNFGDKVKVIPEYVFDSCIQEYPISLTIPNSVQTIGNFAFYRCSGLTSVVIGDSVRTIGDNAFRDCSGLSSVTIGNSVETIGDNAFRDCKSLPSVTLPNSVETIGESTFSGCSALNWVILPPSLKSIDSSVFDYTGYITSIAYPSTINENFTRYPYYFKYAIQYPAEGTVIENGFVWGPDKTALYYVAADVEGEFVVPNSVKTIGERAFSGCSGLTSVVIGNSVETIGHYAFSGCDSLTSVVIPNSVKNIEYAFANCIHLTSLSIGNSLENIYDCVGDNLTELSITAQTPPIISYGYTPSSNLTLFVQGESAAHKYATTYPWSSFGQPQLLKVAERIEGSVKEVIGEPGDTIQLDAKLLPEDVSLPYIFWSSTNPDVAYVDNFGMVTLRELPEDYDGDKRCLIIAESLYADGPKLMIPVNGSLLPAESVTLSEHRLNLHEGAMVELTAEVLPADATDKDVVWSSSDETVATVSQDGIVTGIAKGTATIRVALALDAGVYDECVVNVDKFLSGIEEMTDGGDEIDYAAPYEVYSLSGAWLGNSIDSLAPGFYIIRQGGRTAKLMKN